MLKIKKILALTLAVIIIIPILASCQLLCKHEWIAATCKAPKTCSICGKKDGEVDQHKWEEATCQSSKTCSVCGETEGDPNPHDWEAATCELPKTCSVCMATEGIAAGHVWKEATCEEAKTCSVCQKKYGDPLGHTWVDASCDAPKTCSLCKDTEGQPLEHEYKETITTEATCEHDGEKKLTCALCLDEKTETYKKPVYTATEIHDLYASSVGEIITYDKSGNELALGSCFVYSEDGKILTNYHVIDGAYSIKITLDGKKYTVSYVLAYDKDIDLAVLKINKTGLKAADICANDHKTGEPVYAFGSSSGLTATFSQGIITYSNRDLDGVKYTQHDAAISPGNSGGPLINQYGEVVGINTLTIRDSQNLNFAISISELSNLNFSTKLTVTQFYDKECDVLKKLQKFALANGTRDSGGDYTVTLATDYSSDYSSRFTRGLFYDVSTGEIWLLCTDETIDGEYCGVVIMMDEIDGTYNWTYLDSFDNAMSGVLYASTFTSNHLLGYDYNNITSSSTRADVRELSSIMVIYILTFLDTDITSTGVTIDDLGFTSF